jgi:hypothetical protein
MATPVSPTQAKPKNHGAPCLTSKAQQKSDPRTSLNQNCLCSGWLLTKPTVVGRFHAGEELPRCWIDPNDQRLND